MGSDIRDKLAPGQLMLDKIEAYVISYIRHIASVNGKVHTLEWIIEKIIN